MLLWLFEWLSQFYSPFSAVSSLTLRVLLAVLTALGISMVFGGRVIERLRALKYGQAIRNDGPQSHLAKTGTPTMGGILILGSILVTTLLWANLTNPYVWILMVVLVIFGAVGWADDWLKIKYKDPKGLIARKNTVKVNILKMPICRCHPNAPNSYLSLSVSPRWLLK